MYYTHFYKPFITFISDESKKGAEFFTTGYPDRSFYQSRQETRRVPVYFDSASFKQIQIPVTYLSCNSLREVCVKTSYAHRTRRVIPSNNQVLYHLADGTLIGPRGIEKRALAVELYQILGESPKTEDSLREAVSAIHEVEEDVFQSALTSVLRKRFVCHTEFEGKPAFSAMAHVLKVEDVMGYPRHREINIRRMLRPKKKEQTYSGFI